MKSALRTKIRIFDLSGNRHIIDAPEKIIQFQFFLTSINVSIFVQTKIRIFCLDGLLLKLALLYEIRNTFTKNQFNFFDGTY